MNFIDKLNPDNLKPLEGILKIKHIVNGKVTKVQTQNLVLNQGRQVIRDLLISSNANDQIGQIQLGDHSLIYPADTSGLSPPLVSDTGLNNSFFTKNLITNVATTYNGRFAVESQYSILTTEANDPIMANFNKLITELGLLTVASFMMCRVVTTIVKTRDTQLDISWFFII